VTRAPSRTRWAGVVILVGALLLALTGPMVASASKVTLTAAKLKPFATSQSRCTSQTIAVTTPTATAAAPTTKTLIVSGLDTVNCSGLALSVTIYDPKLSAVWTAAQKTSVTSSVTATSLTLGSTTSFTPMVAMYAYVTVGGWQIPATFVPGTPRALTTSAMKESQHGKCLAVQGTVVSGAQVIISTCVTNAATQKWVQMSDGTLRIGGLCLAVPGSTAVDVTPLQILSCVGGGANLQWTQDTTHSDAGTFQWVSGLWWTPDPTTNGCLDNEGEAATDGTRQILYHCINNHGNQEWIFTP